MIAGRHFQPCSGTDPIRRRGAFSADGTAAVKATCIFEPVDSVTKNYTEIWRRLKKHHLLCAMQQKPTKNLFFFFKNNDLKLLRRCENWQANCSYIG